jgi:hypothetical protein
VPVVTMRGTPAPDPKLREGIRTPAYLLE